MEGEYLEAQRLSLRIASELGPPLFYAERREEVERSRKGFESDPMIGHALSIVEERGELMGHGISHVRKVAVDAGALVLVDMDRKAGEEARNRVMRLAHLAGVLHDIEREQPEHALRGAEEAERILGGFDLSAGERLAIAQAIRNHEAFKPATPLKDASLQILSDALYDADKFRWGPDNFTETVWSMVAPHGIPLALLLDNFRTSMRGIARISETFRTPTGRLYGPDFIDRGLRIGERLYGELTGRPI